MKKILSGYFFRAVKTVELWFFVLMVIALPIMGIGTPSMNDEQTYTKSYTLTMTMEETYEQAERFRSDIDPDIKDKIQELIIDVSTTLVISAIALPLFTVLFTGRMFTGGAIRNLVASGHSKSRVYLSALIFGTLIAAVFDILSLLSMSATMLIHHWKIPVFFPFLCSYVLYIFVVEMILVSIVVSILFISKKPVISLIAVAGVILLLFTGSAGYTMYALIVPERPLTYALVKEYQNEHPDSDIQMNWEFDIKNFEDKFTFTDHGEQLDTELFLGPKDPNHISGTTRKILIFGLYSNPACGFLMTLFQLASRYTMWKSGLYTFFCVTNFLWVVVINAAGYTLFRRQELN